MLYLLLTVVLNVLLVVLFRIFAKFKVDQFQAIVFNYITCVITGSLFAGGFPLGTETIHQPWLPFALVMGCGFIAVFNLLSYTTIRDGITTSTIANKLSLVIPVLVSVFLYNEQAGMLKISGIILAVPAVFLAAGKQEAGKSRSGLLLPLILFLSSGALDALVKYVERSYLQIHTSQVAFPVAVFCTAGIAGVSILLVRARNGKAKLAWKHVLAGVCLGIPNYFSIYFFIRMLNSGSMQSSASIPVNNMAILLLSAIVSAMFFSERFDRRRIIGIVLSIVSILLIAFSDRNGI